MSEQPPKIVYNLLIQLGLAGGTTGWGVSYIEMPTGTGNDKFVTSKNSGSVLDDPLILDRVTRVVAQSERPGIQIRVRDKSYDLAERKSQAIRDALLQILEQVIIVNAKSYLIHNFKLTTGVTYIGKEDIGPRYHFTSNWLLSIDEE